nr:unnamed protein product [Digitaria exilis]
MQQSSGEHEVMGGKGEREYRSAAPTTHRGLGSPPAGSCSAACLQATARAEPQRRAARHGKGLVRGEWRLLRAPAGR